MHIASVVAMVRPAAFGYNEETAVNNFFQDAKLKNNFLLQNAAVTEFDAMAFLLRSNGIEVVVLNDTAEPPKPDAIFPNNWFSCSDNRITIFPMHALSRRAEKTPEIIDHIKLHTGISDVSDISAYENENMFLEGTGSMVIDHRNRCIYSCISPRTNEKLLREFAAVNNYQVVIFSAADEKGREIYHTNVMMCIGDEFVVICTEALNKSDKERVMKMLIDSGHEIIDISFAQMNSFAGNMLQLTNERKEKLLVLSKTAHESLSGLQIKVLEKYCGLIVPDVKTIEQAAGGSVRCMMAELFF